MPSAQHRFRPSIEVAEADPSPFARALGPLLSDFLSELSKLVRSQSGLKIEQALRIAS